MEFGKLFVNELLFGFVITAIAFVLGWILYRSIIVRKIDLKASLFQRDNLAAWIEFIGAFVFPALYLTAKAIQGPGGDSTWTDLLVCALYAAAYIAVFTVLRLLSGTFVRSLGLTDEKGKIDLTGEIYTQGNTSAALFSVTLSTVFVSIVMFLDILPGYFTASVFRMLDVLVFTLAAFIVYCLFLRRRTSLYREIFADNNPAAGVSLLGFIFAVETLLTGAVSLQAQFNQWELAATSLVWLVLLGVLSLLFMAGLAKLMKVDLWKEVYEQNSVGAAIGQCALYIGLALVILNYLK